MKEKIIVLLVSMAVLVGVLSGCVEEETPTTNNAPEAGFTYVKTNFTVNFTDTSTDADDDTLTYLWDFGDGVGNSTEADPEYTYAVNGSYTVKLTVSDGTDTDDYEEEIVVGNVAPTASFIYEPTNLSVNFTDTSTDPNGVEDIVNWTWDFGDENMSYDQNPTYLYAAEGNYTVILTVTDFYCLTDNETKTVEVTE